MNFCRQPDAAAFLAHVNQNAVAFLGNLPERRVQLISTVAPARREDITSETLAMNAHQRRLVFVDLAFHECEMMLPVKFRTVQMQIEIAVIGRHFHDLLQLHQLLANATVGDQTLDRADAQPVFLVEFH